ncbi:hypothetical protein ACMFMG_005242 [Clarireedia jacksonii]
MRSTQVFIFLLSIIGGCLGSYEQSKKCANSRYDYRHRVFIATDISNEPDDQMSLVRFLTYANELDIQGIAVVTSFWKNDSLDLSSVMKVLNAYENVTTNLNANVPEDAKYPTAADLRGKVKPAQPVYGLAALNLQPSEAAMVLVNATDAATSEDPLWVCFWGGASVLAEALQVVNHSRTPEELSEFVHKLRVYSISDQDDAGAWLRDKYPSLFYIVALHGFNEYTQASWNGISGEQFRHFDKGGPDTSLITNDWLQTYIRIGDLGAHYLNYSFIMEGDTPSFFPLIRNGLGDPNHPEWGSWGGRFLLVDGSGRYPVYSDASDVAIGVNGEIYVSAFATIWRWRKAYQYDFAARMQWTINRDFSMNNHHPVAIVNGTCGPDVTTVTYNFGDCVVLDASESWDPDDDSLSFDWFHYREVTLRMQEGPIDPVSKNITITSLNPSRSIVSLEPRDNVTMHIILTVEDNRDISLATYRRIILTPKA